MHPRRVGISTLGCKVNRFESELIAESLGRVGCSLVNEREEADLYIINTCTVTREADRQARQAVRRAIRRNPSAVVVVTGCYAQIAPDSVAKIPGVDHVIGNDRKLDLHALLTDLGKRHAANVMVGDLDEHVSLPNRLLEGYEDQTRAFVQVQQGCNQGCTFCIIHRARGPSRSLPPTLVKQQVERLAAAGFREIVICGVDLGSYGEDLAADGQALLLPQLLSEICAIEQDFRIRLSSIDPAHLSDDLIALMAESPKLCPHLHLSLQSGSTLILKRMKRRYDAEFVYERIARMRDAVPGLVLSADIMVGFPTETGDQFADSVKMVTELGVAYPHVFPYSERAGTPAARIPGEKQVPRPTRRARAETLREAGSRVREELLESRIGGKDRVLVEGGPCPLPGYQKARAPDYIETWVPATAGLAGEWLDVEFEAVRGDALIARTTA